MPPDSPAHRSNSFDALRLAAAVMVVVGHAYVLSGRGDAEPLARHTGLGGFGELGVSIFFVISGYLVASSYARLGNLRVYLANRLLRILPALAVATLLTALVLGPTVSTLAPQSYFVHAQTWLYPARNVLLYPVTYLLPGVFEGNPYPGAVNGSLWTLRLEFTLYLLLPVLAAVRMLNRWGLAAAAVAVFAAYLAQVAIGPGRAPAITLIGARYSYLFLAGSALFAWRDGFKPQSLAVLGPALVLFLLGAASDRLGPLASVAATPFLVAGLGLSRLGGLSGPLPFGDLSYGVYIYAFPIQQTLMQLLGPQRLGFLSFFLLTLVVVLPLAAASWWLVERPALRLKHGGVRPTAGEQPAPSAA